MNMQLIKGQFSAKDAIDLITQMIQVKIKFHENKITVNSNEEDIKLSESKIKRLQKDLFEMRKHIESIGKTIAIQSTIAIQ
jgi:hypothetical protein